jgi:molybdopterin-guanine dinucleotide biosynthesis protein A
MTEFSAALLAGGRSRRMGTDKAFLLWQGRPLWERQLEKLRALGPSQLLLSCCAEQPFPILPEIMPVYDDVAGCGPLGGVAACLGACETSRLLVLGVDLPHLPAEFMHSLLAYATNDCGAVVSLADYFEPLAAVYSRAMLPLAEEQLAGGRLAMQDFIRRGVEQGMMCCAELPVKAEWFANWNSPQDIASA